MRDVLFLLLAVGFFALAAAYVRACAAVAGIDDTDLAAPVEDGDGVESGAAA